VAAGDSVEGGQQVPNLGVGWMGAPKPLDGDPQHCAKAKAAGKSPGCVADGGPKVRQVHQLNQVKMWQFRSKLIT